MEFVPTTQPLERPAPLSAPAASDDVESRTIAIGKEIFSRLKTAGRRHEGSWLERWMMEFGMRDEQVKAQLFRFIDVLPTLTAAEQINAHLAEYLGPVADRLPWFAGRPVKWIPRQGWASEQFASLVRYGSRRMARRFIAATDLPEAIKTVQELRNRSLAFTIDLLGEAVLSEAEADIYQRRYLDLIEGLADDAANWKPVELVDEGPDGPSPRVNVSIKLSSLFSHFDAIDPEGTDASVLARLRPILQAARRRRVFVNIDMEQYAFKDATLRIFRKVFSEDAFCDWADVGIAVQAYLKDTGDDLKMLAEWAGDRATPVWVRLVKGAYSDYESVVAAQNDWPSPVWEHKPQTDASFERLTAFLFARRDQLRPAVASHNVRSIAMALAQAEACQAPPGSFEFQMLFGMAEPIKGALTAMGHRVRVYTPFGDLLPGMAYLVRRLLENTSNESFLRAGFHDQVPQEQLLMNPLETLRRRGLIETSRPAQGQNPASAEPVEPKEFVNESITDFSKDANRRALTEAMASVKARLGGSYPLVVGGQRVDSGEWIVSVNPAHKQEVVGRAAKATAKQANAAVEGAKAAFPAWRDTPARDRAQLLFTAARIMRRRRFELAAWEIFETAKQWREADADVAEAIDFCEFYGREIIRLSEPRRRDVPGESNEYFHEGRGVVVAIAPWNFPLAILCGMTSAALAAGNAVIMKPAEQSAVVAAKLMEVFYEAGFPEGVVNYLPGVGEDVGPTLVQHPNVSMIAFTGSRAVGLAIARQAAETPAGQEQIKRVILELGGKNAVIVDNDADLDEAVHGVVASAFGYSGQKCSACSRVICLGGIYDAFVSRLVEVTRSLRVGPADDPGAFVGPVIDEEARQRILRMVGKSKEGLKVAYQGDLGELADEGFYVPPTIFVDVPAAAPLAMEEIFGPVLAVIKAGNLDEAIAIANGTPYALTGGIFSRSPANLAKARAQLRVGNLYINRKITGALVDRQPFGGMKLSGVGSKAGGPDYLQQFMVPRTITENMLRRGFAPESESPEKNGKP